MVQFVFVFGSNFLLFEPYVDLHIFIEVWVTEWPPV